MRTRRRGMVLMRWKLVEWMRVGGCGNGRESVLRWRGRWGMGVGGVLVVEGPAGIGKTRLLREARVLASGAGLKVLSARGTTLERGFAFGVVRQLFEPVLTSADKAEREALWEGPAGQARQVFGHVDPSAPSVGDFAVLHGLFWLAANASQSRPVLLLVDDLQWCDVPSLRFLAYLRPRVADLPLLVVAGLRSGEPVADASLLLQLTADPTVQVLRPAPLSRHVARQLLERALPAGMDLEVAEACHRVTGGNPLLLQELARTAAAEGFPAGGAGLQQLEDLAVEAVGGLVAARMARLPAATLEVARAAAVLGDGAPLRTTAALAGQEPTAALEAATALEELDVLHLDQDPDGAYRLGFVHPLVRTAVYRGISPTNRARAHRHTADLLTASGTDPERVAAHLLRVPPSGDQKSVALLRAAAGQAIARGAPGNAYTYLNRALHEPPASQDRLQVLTGAGESALLVNYETAAEHLQHALQETDAPAQRARISARLGMAYMYLMQGDRAMGVWSRALAQLPAEAVDQRYRLEAEQLMAAAFVVPGHQNVLRREAELRKRMQGDSSVGVMLLDCAVALRGLAVGDPSAILFARHALSTDTLIRQAAGNASIMGGWYVLLCADDDLAMASTLAAVQQAHRDGSLYALGPAYTFHGYGWLLRGQLAEAEHDLREAVSVADLIGAEIARYYPYVFLAMSLAEQGRLEEAERILATVGAAADSRPSGPAYFALAALARIQAAQGNPEAALKTALAARDVCRTYDIRNPALVGWRTEAALALYALDRSREALEIATEDLALARRWGAPRALGRALRVNGLLAGRGDGLDLLHQAVTVLEASPARLEHATALTDYGAALRRAGNRVQARPFLRQGLDLATRCGARPLADRAGTELTAAGGRPRTTVLTGPDALTPSERRVAELAAQGHTNKQIAQQLFVTPKTVEVHLSAAYRKLDITTRSQLLDKLPHQL
ncbi:LuxR C-terminal-related transcriptional regulator [Streptomyces sp. NPDC048419]|uniref:helix-turn-helix transcriptional regulator n=1 Tax=Streptomyces sp. NPDC048419 TaxID=3365547 RepID=UPI00371F6E17